MDAPNHQDAGDRFQKIDKVVLLAQCPLFAGLSQWELRSISQLMRLVEYRKDEVVYHEGGEAESFYVIVSGRFEAFVSPADKKKVLAYLRRGDYFGEMSLLTDQPHSATIHALSDSLVLEIKKDGFKKSIEHNATISLELSRRLSSRLKVTESRARSLFKSDVVAICGALPKSSRYLFSVNLAASLMAETHQKTVLLDLSTSESEASVLGKRIPKMPLKRFQNIETLSPEDLKSHLSRHHAGFEYLCLLYDPKDSEADGILTSLLNHLAIDFRFVLADLSSETDEASAKVCSQSDHLFLLSDSHLNSLTEARDLLRDIEKSLSYPEEKMAVIIQEVVFGAHTTPGLRQEIFGKKRCFSLPMSPSGEGEDEGWPVVSKMPDADYSRTVRYIARYLSGNLVGLALGSGAAFGLAHIGVLKVLEREKIPIDIISGSSIGALIGALYAVGLNANEIEKAAMEINVRLLMSRLVDVNIFPFRGLMHGNEVIRHFKKHLGGKQFDQCRVALKVTGANLTTRQSLVFESGSVGDAVRASIAIPAIIRPVLKGGDVIVDGGILNPLPIRALHQAGANKVIAVNVFPTTKDLMEKKLIREEALEKERSRVKEKGFVSQGLFWFRHWAGGFFSPNIFDILMNTIQCMESEIAEIEGEGSDVLLRPVLPNASWVNFYKPGPFIKRGEEEAMKLLPKIKALVSQQNV